ncbi:MAG: tetratricopeptide repeat protein, partial [Candidatus Cloacimonetes bacterium]|nr:tetratricopeptide repeat protein [Candidatus Cloacimonadota bacterium]
MIFLVLISFLLSLAAEDSLESEFNRIRELPEKQNLLSAYKSFYKANPDNFFGQMSLLETAKIHFLDRNYKETIKQLQKISHSDITEKEFWLAKAYLKNNNFEDAIISAQNYIFSAKDVTRIEAAYFFIAESYIQQRKFTRALNTLDFLRQSEFITNNIPLLHYKIGYCQEILGNTEEALQSYKKLKLEYPYHQYSY